MLIEFFFIVKSSRPFLGPIQPDNQYVLKVTRQGRDVDHSPLSTAEVKYEWSYTSTRPYTFMRGQRKCYLFTHPLPMLAFPDTCQMALTAASNLAMKQLKYTVGFIGAAASNFAGRSLSLSYMHSTSYCVEPSVKKFWSLYRACAVKL
jgi:hypothetical protein